MKNDFSESFIETLSSDPADAMEGFIPRKGKSMEMIQVESTNIKEIGYDEETQTLRVSFKRGSSTYDYQNFPKEKFEEFRSAPSVGGYFSAFIKNLPCKKVEG